MATDKGAYLSKAVLNTLRGTAMPTIPANYYLALLTTMPSDANGTSLVEVSGGSYARQPMACAAGTWAAPALQGDNVSELISNSAAVTFPSATANWGTIVGCVLYDSLPQSTPAAPSVTGNTGTGSGFTSGQTVKIAVTYKTPGGETAASATSTATITTTGNNVVVTLPSFPTGVVSMSVYASISNGSATLQFAANSTSSGGSVTVTAFGSGAAAPSTDSSGGNILYYGALSANQVVNSGNVFQFPTGNLTVSEK